MSNGVLVLCAVSTSVATGWWLRNWRASIVYAREVERVARLYPPGDITIERLRSTRRAVERHERRAALIVVMFVTVSAFNWYAVLSAVRR